MKSLQLHQLGEEAISDLKESFNNLPHTEHKDGKFRLRRYAAIELRTSFWNAKREAEITVLPHRDFLQSEEFNNHQGGMIRTFEGIEKQVFESQGMKNILLTLKESLGLIDGQEIEIHQLRVVTLEDGRAEVAPEGVHQDGYDDIAIVGINRHNIRGGELLAYQNQNDEPFLTYQLQDGDILMLDDGKFWHNASPIVAGGNSNKGYGDWFVLCIKR
jgi:hypothetical protein